MGESAVPVDLLVIGGGPGGYAAALRAAQLGRRVTMVEAAELGGTCLNVGCIPSKALIEVGEAHEVIRRMLSEPSTSCIDLRQWQEFRHKMIGDLMAAMTGQLNRALVEVIRGQARLTSRSRVAVQPAAGNTVFLEFRQAVVATGSRPTTLDHGRLGRLGVDDRIVDSTGALALTSVPERLLVIGAGYIGIELATAFAKLGASVTVIEMGDRILPELPVAVTRPVAIRLRELGVTVHTSSTVIDITELGVDCQLAGKQSLLFADKILVTVGRRPNTDDIGLEAARVPTNAAGRIAVGADRVVPGTTIAAVGDVTEGPMLAHKATAEGMVAAEALCGRRVAFDPAAIPLVVFSDPEVASAGHTEASAKEAGIHAVCISVPIGTLGRAATMKAHHGLTQVVVDTDHDAVIGVHLACPHASELIAEGVLAIELAAAPGDLAASIHAHPTLAEGIKEAAIRSVPRWGEADFASITTVRRTVPHGAGSSSS